jgi:hypothetical protein
MIPTLVRHLPITLVASAWLVACGAEPADDDQAASSGSPSDTATAIRSFCDDLCAECVCSAGTSACVSELTEGADAAAARGCAADFRSLLRCASNNLSCDPDEIEDACESAADDLSACMGGGETCRYTNDGACDEPEGTDLCPEGSDEADCECRWTNDGACDEPEGTDVCPEGSDEADCECPWTNDGECDEPEGTGLCPEGSDVIDC